MGNNYLIFLNVHLEAFHPNTRKKQVLVLKDLVDSLVDDFPILVVGDFNAHIPFSKLAPTDEDTMKMFYNHPQVAPAIDLRKYTKN